MLPSSPTSTFPYRLLCQVGEGAMGQVFRAEDIELGRQVAIKVVKPSFLAALSERDAQDALQRFVQEARAAASLTHPGVTVVHRVGSEGGWPYAAPEQLAGRAVDARADLYALGAVLYEAVVGQPPFEADSLYELMGLVQTEVVTPASRLVPGVPAAFDAFVERALAKKPEERFASAAQMARALQAFLTPKPGSGRKTNGSASVGSEPTLLRVPTVLGGDLPHLRRRPLRGIRPGVGSDG